MLSRIMIFVFTVFFLFTIIWINIPSGFMIASYSSVNSPNSANKIPREFSTANITVYSTLGSDNMTYPYTSLNDAPHAPQWNSSSGHYLEVWWSQDNLIPISVLELREASSVFGGWSGTRLAISYKNGTSIPRLSTGLETYTGITKSVLIEAWDQTVNASVFYAQDNIKTSIMFRPTLNYETNSCADYVFNINEWWAFYGSYWGTQTFTSLISTTLKTIQLKLIRQGNPGTIIIGIRAADSSGNPIGNDLTNTTINGNSLSTTEDYSLLSWTSLSFSYPIFEGTKYAIVIRAPTGDSSNKVLVWADSYSHSYSGGNELSSSNSGTSWTAHTTDFNFHAIGVSIVPSSAIGEAWDAGKLSYSLSYDVNLNGTKFSIWTLIAGAFSFSAFDLGIGGVAGTIFNACINLPLTAALYYIITRLTLAIIPFISGLHGD